jgi:cob(I)alamin adenosyltransferase
MDISTFIATPPYDNKHPLPEKYEQFIEDWVSLVGFSSDNILYTEKLIDRLDSLLPPIKNFVLPGGNMLISQIHVCRALTRKCERMYIDLCETVNKEYLRIEQVNQEAIKIGIYLNRLSDLLFVLSRFVSMTLNVKEDLYSKNKINSSELYKK